VDAAAVQPGCPDVPHEIVGRKAAAAWLQAALQAMPPPAVLRQVLQEA